MNNQDYINGQNNGLILGLSLGMTQVPNSAQHLAEFGSVNGTGNLYFHTKYTDTPVHILRGEGTLSWLTDADGKYIGLTITGSGITDVVCYCTLSEEE